MAFIALLFPICPFLVFGIQVCKRMHYICMKDSILLIGKYGVIELVYMYIVHLIKMLQVNVLCIQLNSFIFVY